MLEATKGIIERVNLTLKPPEETWQTLPEPDQDAWREFFIGYGQHALNLSPEDAEKISGTFSHIWAMACEYQKVYGSLWE